MTMDTGNDDSDLIDAMQSVRLEGSGGSSGEGDDKNTMDTSHTTDTTSSSPSQQQHQQRRSSYFDVLKNHGPPADPIPFSNPKFNRGRRANVLCYNSTKQTYEEAKNVLFKDHSRGGNDDGLGLVQEAYMAVPGKRPISTIMGHVQICIVLRRCATDNSDDDDDDSSENDDEEDELGDEDITFETTDNYVAIKVNYWSKMKKLKGKHAEDPMQEIAAMQLIGNDHPHVLGCLEVLYDDGRTSPHLGPTLNVILPFCGGGDLFEVLQESQQSDDPGMSEPQARYWFRQIISGLQHLHQVAGICHRDLSPENVMLNDNKSLIIDMGMCLRIPYSRDGGSAEVTDIKSGTHKRLFRPQGACGKLPYMAPEIYRNKEPFDGGAVDIFTAATILFCMLTGNRSYQRAHNSDPQFYWMTHGLPMLLSDWGVVLSAEAVDLLQGMLKVDPRERYTLDQVINHAWFAVADDEGRGLT